MTARSVPAGLAPILELLELEQLRVVTTAQMSDLTQEADLNTPVDVVIRRLRERGWLLPLATKGVWEFAPAARAGAFGSGDPLIELRAVLARDLDAPYSVAAESAAYLLGLASRRPDTECIGAPPGVRPPKSLGAYRLARWSPTSPLAIREGLPVWPVETLLAFMASRPSGYRDWPNVGEWLALAAGRADPEILACELADRPVAAWFRAAYLIDRGGAEDAARALAERAPSPASGPYYLGDRDAPGRYDARYDVIDSTGLEVVSG